MKSVFQCGEIIITLTGKPVMWNKLAVRFEMRRQMIKIFYVIPTPYMKSPLLQRIVNEFLILFPEFLEYLERGKDGWKVYRIT